MDAQRPNVRPGAAQQAERADGFCVQAVDQRSGVAHNHLQACWDRLCALGEDDNKRRFYTKRTTQEQRVLRF